jgi:apolipoprotein N-acyltransferase
LEDEMFKKRIDMTNHREHASIGIRIFGVVTILAVAVELLLCWQGPMAFIHKPSLMLFPPFANSLDDAEKRDIAEYLEREIALCNTYAIVGQAFLEEYYLRTDPEVGRSMTGVKNVEEARAVAEEIGLERFAFASVWKSSTSVSVTLTIRNTRDGEILRRARVYASSIDELMSRTSDDIQAAEFRETIRIENRGVGFTDYLVLLVFAMQLLLGLMAVSGRNPGMLVDAVLAPAAILFLFAIIHARSANMDYIQRFIADGGQLKLAQSTGRAQMFAVLRYGPLLLLTGGYYIIRNIREPWSRKPFGWRPRIYRIFESWGLAWSMVSAVLFALSFPSFLRLEGIPIFGWIALVPLFLVLIVSRPGKAMFYGVVFGTVQALIINYWHGTYNYVTLHMITIAFVVEYVLFMVPFVAVIKLSGKWGFLMAPALWTTFDYLRSSGILGYPWALAGTSQYSFYPLIQIASITGVWGIGFLIILVNAGIAWSLAALSGHMNWPAVSRALRRRLPAFGNARNERAARRIASSVIPVATAMLVLIVSIVAGSVILRKTERRIAAAPDTATILLVQQNTDPRRHEYQANIDKLIELTDRAISEYGFTPDLIAWPEGGFKLDIRYWTHEQRESSYWGRVVREFKEYQQSLDTWIATGTQDHEFVVGPDGEQEKRNFNSSVLLDPDGNISAFYHKMRLVPFSEHFPLDKEKYEALYEMFQEYDISNWTVGAKRFIYDHPKMRIATPICFEDVFPDHVRQFVVNDVDVILNMSNDYWSLTPVEGVQHAIFALFRAVENRRPLLRSTASGYTVHISATGRIQPGAPEPYTAGYTLANVPLIDADITFYTRWGDWFPKLSALLCALVVIVMVAMKLASGSRSAPSRKGLSVPMMYRDVI